MNSADSAENKSHVWNGFLFALEILRSRDGRRIAKWVSEGKIEADYAARLYRERRLKRFVKLPEWLS